MTSPKEDLSLPLSIKEKLADLEQKLRDQNPGFATVLQALHAETGKHPEYVYALSDEEIALIVSGYERYTKLTIDVGKVTKKQAAMLTVEDI